MFPLGVVLMEEGSVVTQGESTLLAQFRRDEGLMGNLECTPVGLQCCCDIAATASHSPPRFSSVNVSTDSSR